MTLPADELAIRVPVTWHVAANSLRGIQFADRRVVECSAIGKKTACAAFRIGASRRLSG